MNNWPVLPTDHKKTIEALQITLADSQKEALYWQERHHGATRLWQITALFWILTLAALAVK